MAEDHLVWAASLAGEHRQDVPAIGDSPRGRLDPGGSERGGEQIHHDDQFTADPFGRDLAGPAGDARNTVASLPGGALHAAQPPAAAAVPRAVVAGEEDQSFLFQSMLL